MKKKKQTPSKKKHNDVKSELKDEKLLSDITYTIITNEEQAIALSESERANVGME